MMDINYWAVLVSAVVAMVIGSIWFGPLFGKMFMREAGMDKLSAEEQAKMKKTMGMSYFLQLVGSLVTFYVLARFIGGLEQMTVGGGIMVALWVWIGFIVPTKLADTIWGGKWSLFWLVSGDMLVTLVATGAIIGGWK
jgi:hypothetical protein